MKRNMSRFLVVVMLVAVFVSVPNTIFAKGESFEPEDIEILSNAPHKIWVDEVSKWAVVQEYVYHEKTQNRHVYRGYLRLVRVDGLFGIYEGYLYREDLPLPTPTKLKLEQE